MDDYADLEAQMARAESAQTRVDAHGPHLVNARIDPEHHRNALRTLQLHGTPQLHDWLLHLENDVIELLHPDNRDYFRRRQ